MGLNQIGKKAAVTLREPSLGPVFGMKGGATGGGRAKVYPTEDINLNFTGDIHAVTAAHNLIAASIDNYLFRRVDPLLDVRKIFWNRVMDMNDRALRNLVVGLGGKVNGFPRESGFGITASSEVMAILCLSESYPELKERLGKILLGLTVDDQPVFLNHLRISGAVAAILRDALKPNLVQTSEGTPAFVHGGPFANIAQGTCSVLSMKLALKISEFVVTEAGFGCDLGAEKFFDIVSQKSGLDPKAVVLVASVRALKLHGGVSKKELDKPNPEAMLRGFANLEKHLENVAKFKLPAVVAINRFPNDTTEEIETLRHAITEVGAQSAIVTSFEDGGKGAVDLAEKIVSAVDHANQFEPLYPLDSTVEEKINRVSQEIYGASGVDFSTEAKVDLKLIERLNLTQLPVCIAKTQYSLSDNPELLGKPQNFTIKVRNIGISSGAGFLVPFTGAIMLMPGLPKTPSAESIDIDENGKITGLL